jgi:hypothetical protein
MTCSEAEDDDGDDADRSAEEEAGEVAPAPRVGSGRFSTPLLGVEEAGTVPLAGKAAEVAGLAEPADRPPVGGLEIVVGSEPCSPSTTPPHSSHFSPGSAVFGEQSQATCSGSPCVGAGDAIAAVAAAFLVVAPDPVEKGRGFSSTSLRNFDAERNDVCSPVTRFVTS